MIFKHTHIWKDTHLAQRNLHSMFDLVGTHCPSVKRDCMSERSVNQRRHTCWPLPRWTLSQMVRLVLRCKFKPAVHLSLKCSTICVLLTCQTFAFSCGSRQPESPGRSLLGEFVESGLKGINRAKATDSAALGLLQSYILNHSHLFI